MKRPIVAILCFLLLSVLPQATTVGGGSSAQGAGFVLPILKRDSLLNGLQLVVIEQPGSENVSLRLRINGGATFDLAEKGGMSDLTAAMILRGGGGLSAANVREVAGQFDIQIALSVNWDYSDIVFSGPAHALDSMVEVLSRLVLSPAFEASELETLKAERIAMLRQEDTLDGGAARRKTLELSYGSHPFGRPSGGTPESVSRLTRDDLIYFHNRFYVASNSTLVAAGDLTAEQVTRLGRSLLGSWKKGEIVPATFRPPDTQTSRPVVILDRPESTSANIQMSQIGLSRKAPDYIAAAVMAAVLSENLSRALENGATASVGLEARVLAGPLLVSIETPIAQTGESVQTALREIERLRSVTPGFEVVERAKSLIIEAFEKQMTTPEGVERLILDIETYSLGRDYMINFVNRVIAVAPGDVRRAAESYLNPQGLSIAVAGPAEHCQGLLKDIGEVRVIPSGSW